MIFELIALAIVLMIIVAILKKMLKISFRVFGIAIAVFIILAILGYVLWLPEGVFHEKSNNFNIGCSNSA